jgi:hypothetical protein
MGLSIFLADERKQLRSKRYPLRVSWRFRCDGFHGFFEKPEATFFSGDEDFAYSTAMATGWKESFDRGVRKFYCPSCSGKGNAK